MSSSIRTFGIFGIAMGLLLGASTCPSLAETFEQKHPRRAEVLQRTRNLNHRDNKNYGNLHGHYGQIKKEDQSIKHQERRDAKINGGFITKGEQKQINHEENHVSKQIQHDK